MKRGPRRPSGPARSRRGSAARSRPQWTQLTTTGYDIRRRAAAIGHLLIVHSWQQLAGRSGPTATPNTATTQCYAIDPTLGRLIRSLLRHPSPRQRSSSPRRRMLKSVHRLSGHDAKYKYLIKMRRRLDEKTRCDR